MKKAFPFIALTFLMLSCNSGNEGSDSIYNDSLRIADSTKLADSLDMVDATERFGDTSLPVQVDTSRQ